MTTARRLAAFWALSSVAWQCTPPPEPNPPVQPVLDAAIAPPEPHDASLDVGFGAGCPEACAVLVWLGCPEGEDTPRGQGCTTKRAPDGKLVLGVCEQTQDMPNFSLPTWCVSRARTREEVRKCPGVRCP